MSDDLVPPWKDFLEELDSLLSEPFEVHCIGGFAAVTAYGLPRSTNDLDYYSLEPGNRGGDFERIAGGESVLARKHHVHVHRAAVATLPERYVERMTELFPRRFNNIRLFVLDPYDMVLSKLSRNAWRDREDAKHIVKTQQLDAEILRTRYEQELKPCLIGPIEVHDTTFRLWMEMCFSDARR